MHNLKKGLENQLTFCKKLNHTDLDKHVERKEQLHYNYRKIKQHKRFQRCVYNQNTKCTAAIALLPKGKTSREIMRSFTEIFDWKSKCMFCSWTISKNQQTPRRSNQHKVTTLHFKEKVLPSCQKQNEQISKQVALRMRSCNNLVAVELRSHTSCRIIFINPEKT